jgi:undecaprenyl-diphosphatase
MWQISSTFIWIPLYLVLLFFIFRKLKWKAVITLVLLILMVLLSDQGSVHFFKNVFMRLRPCHEPALADLVHLVNGKCGGRYGFISSHAANTFALAMFMGLFFKKPGATVFFFLWASIVSYSRIYLGVHYPFDILGGALWGCFCGFVFYWLNQKIFKVIQEKKSP